MTCNYYQQKKEYYQKYQKEYYEEFKEYRKEYFKEYYKEYGRNRLDIKHCRYPKEQLNEFDKTKPPITCTEYFDDI